MFFYSLIFESKIEVEERKQLHLGTKNLHSEFELNRSNITWTMCVCEKNKCFPLKTRSNTHIFEIVEEAKKKKWIVSLNTPIKNWVWNGKKCWLVADSRHKMLPWLQRPYHIFYHNRLSCQPVYLRFIRLLL